MRPFTKMIYKGFLFLLLLAPICVKAQLQLIADPVSVDTLTHSGYMFFFTTYNNHLIFVAQSDTLELAPWISDGTPTGTFLLKDLATGLDSFLSTFINYGTPNTLGGELYFPGWMTDQSFRLWKTDGTTAGTETVASGINVGSPIGGENTTLVYNNELFFQGLLFDSTQNYIGSELWKVPASGSSYELVKDISPGFASGKPEGFVQVNGVFVFTAETPLEGREIWVSDGTTTGTQLLKDVGPGSLNGLNHFFPKEGLVGNLFFFVGFDDINHRELWATDGTPLGTYLVKDINPGLVPSNPLWFTPFDNQLMFIAEDGLTGRQLWISDGTDSGTQLIKKISPGFSSAFEILNGSQILATDSIVFFQATNDTSGLELWRSDGTENGTFLLKDLVSGPEPSSPREFVKTDSLIYFIATNDSLQHHIWQSDGTGIGTQIANGFPVNSPFSVIWEILSFDSMLYVVGLHPEYGTSLFTFHPNSGITAIESPDITHFPNPVTDELIIRLKNESKGIPEIHILDLNGRRLNMNKITQTSDLKEFRIDVSGMASGVYLLQIRAGGTAYTGKFVHR